MPFLYFTDVKLNKLFHTLQQCKDDLCGKLYYLKHYTGSGYYSLNLCVEKRGFSGEKFTKVALLNRRFQNKMLF